MTTKENSVTEYKILNDKAISDAKYFNFNVFVDSIQNLILNPEIETPFTLVINGKWGSGKTSLMRTIKKSLDNSSQKTIDKKVKTVWFNAWKYSDQDNLIAELAFEIYQTVVKEKGPINRSIFGRLYRKIRFFHDDKRINYYNVISDFSGLINPTKGIGIGSVSLEPNKINVDKWLNKPFYTDNLTFYNRFQQYLNSVINIYVLPEFTFKDKFNRYLDVILNRSQTDQNDSENLQEGVLIIFIDDLDRCSPKGIANILETINLFFDHPGCFFVFGLDIDIVSTAIDIHYKEFNEKKIFSGNDYIKKMFQLQFDLPDIRKNEMKEYIEIEIGTDESIKNIIELIIESLEGNPREIKRFINSFNFLRILKSAHPNLKIKDELLAKWVLLTFISSEFIKDIKSDSQILVTVQKYTRLNANEFKEYYEANDQIASELFLKYKDNPKIYEILYSGTNEFSIENISSYIYLSTLTSAEPKTNQLNIVASGDGSYYFGELIKLSGISSSSSKIFLFMTGPELNPEGVALDSPYENVINGDPKSFTNIEVKKDHTWEYEWNPVKFGKNLKKGVYEIYISDQPFSKSKIVNFDKLQIVIKEPFITGTLSSPSIAQGDLLYIRGIAEGNPIKVNIWIFGPNYYKRKGIPINNDSSYEYRLHRDLTAKLPVGQYFVVIQHPMINNKFDVILENNQLVGTWNLTKKYSLENKQGADGAELLINLINNPLSDDSYSKLTFLVEEPFITIDPISQVSSGKTIMVTGYTNISPYNNFFLTINPTNIESFSKEQIEIILSQNDINIKIGTGSHNLISSFIDTTGFPLGNYQIQIKSINPDVTGIQTFKISKF